MSGETAQVSGAARVGAASCASLALESARREPLETAGSVALVLLAPAALVYLSFNAGGYFPTAPAFVTIVLAQALVLRTTLAARPFEGFGRALAVPLAALALYAAWQLASVLWSHATARTLDSYDLTLLYLLAFALFGSVRYTRERAAWLIRAVVAGLTAVCLIGLISRVLPHAWPTSSSFFAERLNYPLTYWNAEGMVAAIVLILALHLCADRAEHWSVRVLAATAIPGDRRHAAAHLLARRDGRSLDRSARLLPADAREHAADGPARRRAHGGDRCALCVGRDAARDRSSDEPSGGRTGPPRRARRRRLHARRRSAARAAAGRRSSAGGSRARAQSAGRAPFGSRSEPARSP